MTRSRRVSPRNSVILGALGIAPHSTATRNTRLRTRSEEFTELTANDFPLRCFVWREAAKSDACSLVISESGLSAKGLYSEMTLRFGRYHPNHVLGDECSNRAFTRGS